MYFLKLFFAEIISHASFLKAGFFPIGLWLILGSCLQVVGASSKCGRRGVWGGYHWFFMLRGGRSCCLPAPAVPRSMCPLWPLRQPPCVEQASPKAGQGVGCRAGGTLCHVQPHTLPVSPPAMLVLLLVWEACSSPPPKNPPPELEGQGMCALPGWLLVLGLGLADF